MKIEAGKFYKTRNNTVVKLLIGNQQIGSYFNFVASNTCSYTESGAFLISKRPHSLDLIAEATILDRLLYL